MSIKELEMSENDFWELYDPISNHIDPSHGFNDCLFETYDGEFDFVSNFDERHVWTVLDCDGELMIASGLHLVNRLGYLITLHPIQPDTSITVKLD